MLRLMHLRRPGFFAVFAFLTALRLVAAEPTPAIWRLDSTVRIGGHASEVIGAPRVVAGPAGAAVEFNGTSDGLLLPVNPLHGLEAFTIELCLKPATEGPEEQRFLHVQEDTAKPNDPASRALLELRLANGTWALDAFLLAGVTKARLVLLDPAKRHPAGRWTWVAMVYAHGRLTSYVDGVRELEGDIAFPPMGAGRVSLGVRQNKVSWFKGGIREVRWHRVALAPAELQRVR